MRSVFYLDTPGHHMDVGLRGGTARFLDVPDKATSEFLPSELLDIPHGYHTKVGHHPMSPHSAPPSMAWSQDQRNSFRAGST